MKKGNQKQFGSEMNSESNLKSARDQTLLTSQLACRQTEPVYITPNSQGNACR